MADEVVLSFHDSLLRKSDLSLLEEGRWLNDRLIGFVFDYFTHNKFKQISDIVTFISPDVTQFLKLGEGIEIGIFLEPLDLPSQKMIFFTVNNNDSRHLAGGSHWYTDKTHASWRTDAHNNKTVMTVVYMWSVSLNNSATIL